MPPLRGFGISNKYLHLPKYRPTGQYHLVKDIITQSEGVLREENV